MLQRAATAWRRASIRRRIRCSTSATPRAGGKALLIVITADRGLCGSFNTNVIKARAARSSPSIRRAQVALGLVGRKGRDFFRRRGFDVRYEHVGPVRRR